MTMCLVWAVRLVLLLDPNCWGGTCQIIKLFNSSLRRYSLLVIKQHSIRVSGDRQRMTLSRWDALNPWKLQRSTDWLPVFPVPGCWLLSDITFLFIRTTILSGETIHQSLLPFKTWLFCASTFYIGTTIRLVRLFSLVTLWIFTHLILDLCGFM